MEWLLGQIYPTLVWHSVQNRAVHLSWGQDQGILRIVVTRHVKWILHGDNSRRMRKMVCPTTSFPSISKCEAGQIPTTFHCPCQEICSLALSPIIILLWFHNSVSPAQAYSSCSNLTPKTSQNWTEWKLSSEPVLSSDQFPHGPANAQDHCESWFDIRAWEQSACKWGIFNR